MTTYYVWQRSPMCSSIRIFRMDDQGFGPTMTLVGYARTEAEVLKFYPSATEWRGW